MAGRHVNQALMVTVAVAVVTGVGAFAVGSEPGRWVVAIHGAVGLALLVLVPAKSLVVRRAARREGLSAAGVLLAVSAAVTVFTGLAHATGLVLRLGPVTVMQIHVGAGLVATAATVWHGVQRPVVPRSTDLSRRNLLRLGGVAMGGAAAYLALEGTMRVLAWPGRRRRFTGSHERGTDDPAAMPVTQWLDDRVPARDRPQLLLSDASGRRSVTPEELSAVVEPVRALLDCTGGWFAEQTWEAVRLDRLLDVSSGRSVKVTSVTGYTRRFPLRDASRLWLAVGVGGEPLSRGHGAPVRLVAPGRRGFWWVKWVTAVLVEDRPWWAQSPFPLT